MFVFIEYVNSDRTLVQFQAIGNMVLYILSLYQQNKIARKNIAVGPHNTLNAILLNQHKISFHHNHKYHLYLNDTLNIDIAFQELQYVASWYRPIHAIIKKSTIEDIYGYIPDLTWKSDDEEYNLSVIANLIDDLCLANDNDLQEEITNYTRYCPALIDDKELSSDTQFEDEDQLDELLDQVQIDTDDDWTDED